MHALIKNILNKLLSDIRFRLVIIGVLVLLQLLDEALDLYRVFEGWGPELRAVLTNKPLNNYAMVINNQSSFNTSKFHEILIKQWLENLPLDVLWVGVRDNKVSAQPGKTQGIESAGSIWVELKVVLCIVGKMVNFDVATHLQQLVQGLVRLTWIHGD